MRTSVLGEATRVEPRAQDQNQTAAISELLTEVADLTLRLPNGREIILPAPLVEILIASAGELSAGHAVTVLASEVCLTPAEVADLLGLSRPFVVRLLDSGEIPAEFLPGSRHRVVRLADVLTFQIRRERRRKGRQRIAEIVESADLPY